MAKEKHAATFLGGGTGLSYVGEHAYAFSKRAGANVTPVVALDFKTGAHYIRGSFHLSVALQDGDVSSAASYSNICLLYTSDAADE